MHKLRESMLAHNREQSAFFTSSKARSARQSYAMLHSTEILVLKCMDGRLSLTGMTEAPPGIVRPFRNIGGKFDLGWPHFSHEIAEVVSRAAAKMKGVLVFLTYHFSKGDTHRGCAGFHYDTDGARAAAERLKVQFERVFGKDRRVVYPIVVGIETDEDTLIFHGERADFLSMAEVLTNSPYELQGRLGKMYSGMSSQVLRDLAAFADSNRKHIVAIRNAGRDPIEREHREQIIGVGPGFDWVHIPNTMLIVGPYSHDWPDAVATAATIVSENIKKGRADIGDGVLLFGSGFSYAKPGSTDWNMAVERTHYVTRVAREVLITRVPEVGQHLSVLSGVVDGNTWLFHEMKDMD